MNGQHAQVADHLQSNLVDFLALDLAVKQGHWNIVGPGFLEVHEFLDEVHGALQEAIDETAERIRHLGGFPSGNPARIASNDAVSPLADGQLDVQDTVRGLAARTEVVIRQVRQRLEAIEDTEVVTADMVHAHLHKLEHYAWMLRATAG
ncbi:MAG: DNA starvation/stationary phase protection protein [Fimbriimonadaceae bacterium]|nr:DNA starvation/stationary phase protection protein [Fimbriimonadaceae bacterium]